MSITICRRQKNIMDCYRLHVLNNRILGCSYSKHPFVTRTHNKGRRHRRDGECEINKSAAVVCSPLCDSVHCLNVCARERSCTCQSVLYYQYAMALSVDTSASHFFPNFCLVRSILHCHHHRTHNLA